MKITKETHKKLCEVYGETLIKIASEEYTDKELDNILKILLTFLMDMEELDVEVVKENLEYLEDRKLLRIEEELNGRLEKMKNNYTDEVKERLYRHFNKPLYEETQKEKDISFEVQTKHLIPSKKLYYEQQKVLLTMMSSHICTQNEIDTIKELIEQGTSFTASIKQVIRDKVRQTKIKSLCRLQDDRFNLDEATQQRLY